MIDVTEQINEWLKYLGICRQLQEELDRWKNKYLKIGVIRKSKIFKKIAFVGISE